MSLGHILECNIDTGKFFLLWFRPSLSHHFL